MAEAGASRLSHAEPEKADSGLSERVLQRLVAVFRAHPRIAKAALYGSRAMGNWRPASDIDLVLLAPDMDRGEFLAIHRALDDLLLPWKIDLCLWHEIDNPALLDHIERVGRQIYP